MQRKKRLYFRSTYATHEPSPVPPFLEQPGISSSPLRQPRPRQPQQTHKGTQSPVHAAEKSPEVPQHPQPLPEAALKRHQGLRKLGQPLTKALQMLYKSFGGFEEDPREHAAGAGTERSLSRPHQHQWEAFESDPGTRSPFNEALQGR